MLENFSEIRVDSPIEKIIKQIRQLITSGQLKPGDKLPPERKLAERFGVGRSMVRDAIRKLEFYGIVKTLPQSGTVIAGLGIVALEGLISDVLALDKHDFRSLVETRILLEKEACINAAKYRTPDDLVQLSLALKAYEEKVNNGQNAVEEDLLFHIKIAEAGKNNVLKSLLMIITPDIVKNYINLKVCDDMHIKALAEHQMILLHITNQDPIKASESMAEHLNDVLEFSIKMDK